jgi:hypothetical protein
VRLAVIAGSALAMFGCSSGTHRGAVEVVQTDPSGSQRLTRVPDLRFATISTRGLRVIHVNESIRYQQVKGVGAAITDTSGC